METSAAECTRSASGAYHALVPAAALPLPVAALLRRARNAKSAKDRHDAAYYAFEVSIKIAVLAGPPRDPSALARAPLGVWVQAFPERTQTITAPSVLALGERLTAEVEGRARRPSALAPRALLDLVTAYRNRVLGHGSPRPAAFYEEAGRAFTDALVPAWEAGLFLPPGASLAHVESVLVGADGVRRARIISLDGEAPLILDPGGTPVADDILPERLYLRRAAPALEPLHPWLLFREEDLHPRLYCVNGVGRGGPVYLDYASGEVLQGARLEACFPGAPALAVRLLAESPREPEAPAPEGAGGDVVAGYRILRPLGEGGMGVVHLALQESVGREVALKRLPVAVGLDARALARFRREVAALARCDHPNVVKILEAGEERGRPFIAMEVVTGPDLARVARAVREGGALAGEVLGPVPGRPRVLARLFRDAALGLHHLHESGIVHRDVKPANLMVSSDDGRAVVMDLGAALVPDLALTMTRETDALTGTIRYMAPEQLQRGLVPVDRRTDVYGIGASLYELLSGRPVFEGDSEARIIRAVLHDAPAPLARAAPGIPPDLARIVETCLRKDPRARYASADLLARDLDAFLEARPISARPPTLRYILGLAIRRNPAAYATGALLVAVLAATTLVFVTRLDTERGRAEARAAVARRAFDRLVSEVSDRLASETSDAAIATRRALLETAITGLSELDAIDGAGEGGRADAATLTTATAWAYVKLGESLPFAAEDVRDVMTARALRVARTLVASRPDGIEEGRVLVSALYARGYQEHRRVRLVSALACYDEAIAIGRALEARGGAPVRETLGRLLERRIEVLGNLGREPDGETVREAAIQLRRDLAASKPENARAARSRLATTLDLEAGLADTPPDRAAHLRAEAGALRAAARTEGADEPRTPFMVSRGRIHKGDERHRAGDLEGAIAEYGAAVRDMRTFSAENPENTWAPRLIAVGLARAAAVHEEAGRLDVAAALLDESVAIRRSERARLPANPGPRRDLSVGLVSLARVERARGATARSAALAEEALGIDRARLPEESESVMTQEDFLGTLETLAEARLDAGDRGGALALLREAEAHARAQLPRMESLRASHARLLGRLRALGVGTAEPGAATDPGTGRGP